MSQNALLFSVIVPLADGRIDEIGCLRSWCERQDFPRQRYQMVLVSDGKNPKLEREAASLLQPQDRFVRSSGPVSKLYQDGALAAEGPILMFSELHCRAAADCLTALDRWLAAHPDCGGCVRSRHENLNLVAEMEQQVFEGQFAEWSRPDNWRLVLVRGIALPRALYMAAGGFRGEFPAFADVLLAARLHRLGYRIGIVDDAWVTHINSTSLATLRFHAGEYALGEHRFRLSPEAAEFERYVGSSPEWTGALADRLGNPVGAALIMLRTLFASPAGQLVRSWRHGWRLGCCLLGYTARALAAPRRRQLRLLLKRYRLHLQFRFGGWVGSDRLTAFRTLWDLFIQEELVRLALSEPASRLPTGLAIGHSPADAIPVHACPDVYDPEKAHGRAFRWTKPLFRLRWNLPADALVDVVIDTGGLRSPPRSHVLAAFWNGCRIPQANIVDDGPRLRLRIAASRTGAGNELTLVCAPLIPRQQGSSDGRVLGLPIFAVDCRLASDREIGNRAPQEFHAA